ncbi:MAG: tetratricopeptide repeat protein [Elusimicrobia bacterium]|nr:tetratricopeptide repeat protein [Elusimicrobiota bacterium]
MTNTPTTSTERRVAQRDRRRIVNTTRGMLPERRAAQQDRRRNAPAPRPQPAKPPAEHDRLCDEGLKALALYDLEGYELAVTSLREALKVDPSFPRPHAGLAEAYAHWAFRREIDGLEFQSYLDLALEHAESAVELAPQRSSSHLSMAIALRRGRHADPERRKAEAMIALERDPNSARAWYEHWRAFGYFMTDPSLEKALELDPKLFAAHHDRAVVVCEDGRYAEAVQGFRAALAINPRNSLALYNLAMTLMRMDAMDAAKKVLLHAQRLHPGMALIAAGLKTLETEEE